MLYSIQYNKFGIYAKWNFFATSHGKNACDGIGETIKRAAAKASLQRTNAQHILSSLSFYNFCVKYFTTINIHFISNDQLNMNKSSLEKRFKGSITVKGTRGFYRIVPMSTTLNKGYQVMEKDEYKVINLSKSSE